MGELVLACGAHFAHSQARGLHRFLPILLCRTNDFKPSKVARGAWLAPCTLNMMHKQALKRLIKKSEIPESAKNHNNKKQTLSTSSETPMTIAHCRRST
ncbi:hypothetical protein Plhal304r1_c022g0078261 [Plasmopara halstedii]